MILCNDVQAILAMKKGCTSPEVWKKREGSNSVRSGLSTRQLQPDKENQSFSLIYTMVIAHARLIWIKSSPDATVEDLLVSYIPNVEPQISRRMDLTLLSQSSKRIHVIDLLKWKYRVCGQPVRLPQYKASGCFIAKLLESTVMSRGKLGHKVDMDVSSPKWFESLDGVPCEICCLWREAEASGLPRRISGPLTGVCILNVACGDWHTAIFNGVGGKLFTWGDGDKGRLGHADLEKKLLPTCVRTAVELDLLKFLVEEC
ncbi:hypothetical protein POTOM_060171 [Populus tomentosa]|uniref:Uncharacterized protein n=1 Tax=Populus tomentosa TaxID=118781 RepID=A0A8X8C169_POPTO|nr:hypothetical protein POTOM_060171 [Populus tomentosa]